MRQRIVIIFLIVATLLHGQEEERMSGSLEIAYSLQGAQPANGLSNAVIDQYLRTQIVQRLSDISSKPAPPNSSEIIIHLTTRAVDNRVIYKIEARASIDNAVLFVTSRVVYPGLLAESFMHQSVEELVRALLLSKDRFVLAEIVDYPLIIYSSDEGAEVYLGTNEGRRQLGVVLDGKIEVPYYAFERETSLSLRIEKAGYWPKDTKVLLGKTQTLVYFEPMKVFTNHTMIFGLSPTRQGFRVGYRFNLLPDRLFLGADVWLWVQSNFRPNTKPIIHDEFRAHFGTYLFLPEDSFFRISAGLAISTLQSYLPLKNETFVSHDFIVDPGWLALECNFNFFTFFAEIRFPYILDTGGILGTGFVLNEGLPWISLGGTLKWP